MKHAYQLVTPSNTSTVLIHYIGDEKGVVHFAHGNASNQTGRPHIRTCPSVLKGLQDACKHTATAKAYKSHVTKVPPATHMPFGICCKLVPALKKTKKPIVTDEEQAYTNTIGQYLPAAAHLRCWNHVLRDAKRWLQSHGAPAQDVSVYLTDMRGLFHIPTKKEYSEKLDEMAQKWSAPFFDYYKSNIHPCRHHVYCTVGN